MSRTTRLERSSVTTGVPKSATFCLLRFRSYADAKVPVRSIDSVLTERPAERIIVVCPRGLFCQITDRVAG